MTNERQQVAYHEAGHAVVAYRYNHYVGTVTIRPNEATLGRAVTEIGTPDKEQIVVLYAGFAAQRQFAPSADKLWAASDDDIASELLKFLPAEKESVLRAEADRMVIENWKHLEAVAAALLEYETLDDDWTIIVDCIDEGEDWRSQYDLLRRTFLDNS